MINPAVTIGVPVYNEEKYILKTLDSLHRQTYQNIQVIVSNNGSTDSSRQIIESFAKQDSRFSVWEQKNILNPVDHMLHLLKSADTPYFMWLGGHDMISEGYVEHCVTQLEKYPQCSLASGRIHWQREINGPYMDCNEALNTLHMPPRMAMLTWLWSFFSCFQFYAVYRTKIIKQVGIPSFYSPDIAMIADVLLRGGAVFCGEAVFYATQNRAVESMKDQIRRYAGMGINDADLEYLNRPDARMGRFLIPCRDHILRAISNTRWSWKEKRWASAEVRRVFAQRLDYIIQS